MSISQLFSRQKNHLDYFFKNLDCAQAEQFFSLCQKTKGLLILTGVGKSGIIAEKIAMTLVSTGTRALYLPPTNVLHGDLGIFTPDDLLICLSKSGETEELLGLIPFIRRRGTRFAAVVSQSESRLARMADCAICLPVEKELCPFDLAPTTSTAIQLIFGDALAIALMEAKDFSLTEYASNHPAGAIGRKTSVLVEDLMWKDDRIPVVSGNRPLQEVLQELTDKKCGCLVVADSERKFEGIFTDGDLRRALQYRGPVVMQEFLYSLMTVSAITIPKHILAWDALKIMQKDPKRWITVLPVVEEGRVVGLLRMHDIVQAGIS
jgi:arabinose-5-phosphate isomerase